MRRTALTELDTLCRPYQHDADFLAASEKTESVIGTASYNAMTIEQVHEWIKWASEWREEHKNDRTEQS